MKYSISPFIKIFFVTLIILITFPTHLLAYTSNSNALSPTEDDFDLQPGDIILTKGPVLFGFFGHSSIALDRYRFTNRRPWGQTHYRVIPFFQTTIW